MLITSRANERVKAIRALRNRRDRDETGAFFIEGRLVLRAGIETGAVFEQVVVAPDRLDDEDERLALHVPLIARTAPTASAPL
jgi:TrmH family RNA methyltransferase